MSDERWRRAYTNNTYAVCSSSCSAKILSYLISQKGAAAWQMLLSSARQLAAKMLQIRSVPSYFYVYTYCLVKRSFLFTPLSGRLWKHLLPSTSLQQAGPSPTDPPPLPFFGSQPDIEKKENLCPLPLFIPQAKAQLYFLSFSPLGSPNPFRSSLDFFFYARNPPPLFICFLFFTSLVQLIRASEWVGGITMIYI
jgi:hypothetical protein